MDDTDAFDLTSFMPKSSRQNKSSTNGFDFPLDPTLFGSVESQDFGGDNDDLLESDAESDETDAEDELRAGMTGDYSYLQRKKSKPARVEEEFENTGEGEEDIGRLITAIRDSNSGSVGANTALEKEFDRSIQEELEGLDDFGLNGKKRRSKRRTEAELSPEVKALLGRANQHYAMGEYDEAEELHTEIIRIAPSVRMPWYTLATIYEERGNKEKAIMFKLVAAHLSSTAAAASEWAELGCQARDLGLLQQAIYCFSQAIKGDKTDVDSMWDRAILLKLSGKISQAITAFTGLLQIIPHDLGVLRELTPLLAAQNEYQKAADLYLAAFTYYRQEIPHVSITTDPSALFTSPDLESLADFLLVREMYPKVLWAIKTGVRWLQGREKETGWDLLDDDREYDVERCTRAGWEKDARFLEMANVYELDVRLRLRLGIARLKQGKIDEAQRHFTIVLQEEVVEFPELFGAIANAYFELEMYNEALEVFQDMVENDETNGPVVWYKVGLCHSGLGDFDDAKECFEAVVDAEPNNHASKLELAKIYEKMNEPLRALKLTNEVLEARRLERQEAAVAVVDENTGTQSTQPTSRQKYRQQRALEARKKMQTEESRAESTIQGFARLSELDPLVEGDEPDPEALAEWLEIATELVDWFRETRQLFPLDSSKKFVGLLARTWTRKGAKVNDVEFQAREMSTRLERSINASEYEAEIGEIMFRGISFDQWLTMIIKYCFLLVKNDEYESAIETLDHVQEAVIFKQSPKRSLTFRLATIACHVKGNEISKISPVVRWIWLRHQFEASPCRLIFILLSQGSAATDSIGDSNFQKFFVRQLKQFDQSIRGGEVGKDQEDDEEEEVEQARFKPTVRNPLYLLGYGMVLMVTRAWQSAIIYLLRAYELAPQEPLINFCLGVAYLHRALTRQTDNRHHQISQALAFMTQYRQRRGPELDVEVEYNFGRLFHQLGLQSYAVKHYQTVLDKVRQNQEENMPSVEAIRTMEIAKFAAYNLSSLYTLIGNDVLAVEIAEQWLSV